MTLEEWTGGTKADDILQGLQPRVRSPLSFSSLSHIDERNHEVGKHEVWFISARRHSETGARGGSLPLAEDLVGEPTSVAAVSELGKRPSLCTSGNFWSCCLGVLHPTRRTPLKSCRCPP